MRPELSVLKRRLKFSIVTDCQGWHMWVSYCQRWHMWHLSWPCQSFMWTPSMTEVWPECQFQWAWLSHSIWLPLLPPSQSTETIQHPQYCGFRLKAICPHPPPTLSCYPPPSPAPWWGSLESPARRPAQAKQWTTTRATLWMHTKREVWTLRTAITARWQRRQQSTMALIQLV